MSYPKSDTWKFDPKAEDHYEGEFCFHCNRPFKKGDLIAECEQCNETVCASDCDLCPNHDLFGEKWHLS